MLAIASSPILDSILDSGTWDLNVARDLRRADIARNGAVVCVLFFSVLYSACAALQRLDVSQNAIGNLDGVGKAHDAECPLRHHMCNFIGGGLRNGVVSHLIDVTQTGFVWRVYILQQRQKVF